MLDILVNEKPIYCSKELPDFLSEDEKEKLTKMYRFSTKEQTMVAENKISVNVNQIVKNNNSHIYRDSDKIELKLQL